MAYKDPLLASLGNPTLSKAHLEREAGQHGAVTVQEGPVVDGVPFPLLRQPPGSPREGVNVPVRLCELLNAEALPARPLPKCRQLPAEGTVKLTLDIRNRSEVN